MKLLMVVYSGSSPRTVTGLLESHAVHGWTQLPRAHGAGATGRHEETRAWPGDSSVFFTVVSEPDAARLADALQSAAGALPAGERLHAAVMPVERFF